MSSNRDSAHIDPPYRFWYNENMVSRPKVIDFFCGAGGFSEGFRLAGYDIVMGIDNWQPAITTHNANHGLSDSIKNILDFEDIEEINKLPDTEIIIGSPPCVLFSLSNRGGNANKDLGIRLIKAFYRVVAVKKHQKNSVLKAWLMENVPNSRNYVDEKYTFAGLDLGDWARKEGLDPNSTAIRVRDNGAILQSDDYGACQTRKRFVCGEIVGTEAFPMPDAINGEKPTLNSLLAAFPRPLSKIKPEARMTDPNYPEKSLSTKSLRDHFYDTGVYEIEWKKAQNAKLNHPYMGKMSFPENLNKPSRTIMATRSASTREAVLYKSEIKRVGDGEYRTPTVREAATIMGFPLDYQFFGDESTKWRQIGNAVCVQLSYSLAKKISDELRLELMPPEERKVDFSAISYLDNPNRRKFDKPPTRSPKALFRFHPIKSGNMTVDLTNRAENKEDTWGVVAHAGTGEGYKSVFVDRNLHSEAKKILGKKCPELFKTLGEQEHIKRYDASLLSQKNEEYGFVSQDPEHPYQLVQVVKEIIASVINEKGDEVVRLSSSPLGDIKSTMPLSQVMAIYAMGIILFGN